MIEASLKFLFLESIILLVIVIVEGINSERKRIPSRRKLKINRRDEMKYLKKNGSEKEIINVKIWDKVFTVEGVDYAFEDFKEFSILKPDFYGSIDGNKISYPIPSSLWKNTKDDDNEVILGTNRKGQLEFIELYDGEQSTTIISITTAIYSRNINSGVHRSMNTAFTSFQNMTGFNAKNMSYSMTYTDTVITPTAYSSSMNEEIDFQGTYYLHETFDKLLQGNSCGWYRQIGVGIAFDSSFCALVGGASNAMNKIQNIIGLTSMKYRQAGLCTTLQISAIEGHCDPDNDPYRKMSSLSGCSTRHQGLLYDFSKLWVKNRTFVPRDVAHLFVGRNFKDDYTGCSYIGTLCNRSFAYAVESMTLSNELVYQSNLFAHELGHNCGAWHYMKGSGYIMNAQINESPFGFSPDTISQMKNYLRTQHCLSTVFY